jgi:hypothetical protein
LQRTPLPQGLQQGTKNTAIPVVLEEVRPKVATCLSELDTTKMDLRYANRQAQAPENFLRGKSMEFSQLQVQLYNKSNEVFGLQDALNRTNEYY